MKPLSNEPISKSEKEFKKPAGCRGKFRDNLLHHISLKFTFAVPFGGGWITFDWSEDMNWSLKELNDCLRMDIVDLRRLL